MRPEPEFTFQDTTTTTTTTQLSPPPRTCDPQLHDCRWWPYSNSTSDNVGANTAMIIIILLCALICSLALHTSIRCFLRSQQHQQQDRTSTDDQHPKPNNGSSELMLVVAPAALYTSEMGVHGSKCAICLSEFVEGEGVRVLGKCEHVFHVGCIEKWLSFRSSCPICRRSCLATQDSPATGDNVAAGDRCSLSNINVSVDGSSTQSGEGPSVANSHS